MDENQEKKREIRSMVAKKISAFSQEELFQRIKKIEDRLFGFANFVEAKIPLLYMNCGSEVPSRGIIETCFKQHKIVVFPVFEKEKRNVALFKTDQLNKDLRAGHRGVLEPDPEKCKKVPIKQLDIALIPGVAFDEKGGRIGTGQGYYDRFIPKLSSTTRKVALAFNCQIFPQIPMESHDKYVDIIITEDRIIYKI